MESFSDELRDLVEDEHDDEHMMGKEKHAWVQAFGLNLAACPWQANVCRKRQQRDSDSLDGGLQPQRLLVSQLGAYQRCECLALRSGLLA